MRFAPARSHYLRFETQKHDVSAAEDERARPIK